MDNLDALFKKESKSWTTLCETIGFA